MTSDLCREGQKNTSRFIFFFLNVPSRGGLFPMETCGMRVRVVGGSVREWEPEYE